MNNNSKRALKSPNCIIQFVKTIFLNRIFLIFLTGNGQKGKRRERYFNAQFGQCSAGQVLNNNNVCIYCSGIMESPLLSSQCTCGLYAEKDQNDSTLCVCQKGYEQVGDFCAQVLVEIYLFKKWLKFSFEYTKNNIGAFIAVFYRQKTYATSRFLTTLKFFQCPYRRSANIAETPKWINSFLNSYKIEKKVKLWRHFECLRGSHNFSTLNFIYVSISPKVLIF